MASFTFTIINNNKYLSLVCYGINVESSQQQTFVVSSVLTTGNTFALVTPGKFTFTYFLSSSYVINHSCLRRLFYRVRVM